MWNQTEFKERDYDADEFGRFPKGGGYPGNNADWGWLQHILASLNSNGRAAVVLDAGAASRGSGNTNRDKETTVRRWFVEQDVVEAVLLLPENLFYNTPAAGIVMFLNRSKAPDRTRRVLMVNAETEFQKGRPKNFLPPKSIERIVRTIKGWEVSPDYSVVVDFEEIQRSDFNIAPSRYVQGAKRSQYRPISEILDELELLEAEAQQETKSLRAALLTLGDEA